MFYSDFGARHVRPALWEMCAVFFFAHVDVYVNYRLVQSIGYGELVWC